MKTRFPLYAKILLWFFLNLLLVAGAFTLIVRLQLRGGMDSLLAGQAGERLRAVGQVIADELHERPRGEWNSILSRFSKAHRAQFFLFENDGPQIAGEPVQLPPDVSGRLRGGPRDRRRPENRMPPPAGPGQFRSPADEGFGPDEGARRPPQVRDTLFVRTTGPELYWIGLRLGVPGAGQRPPMPATLLVRTPTLTGGGLFVDLKPWLAIGAGVLVLSALFWLPLVHGITRSVSQMTRATGQIAEGQFDARVPDRRNDELGSLAGAINRMAARLAGFVTGQKRFLGDIAHELCAPISRLQVALGILEQRADEKQKTYVDDVREEVQHMSNLVNELLSFSKASLGGTAVRLQTVPVRAVVDEVVRREVTPGVDLKVEVSDDLSVRADPELLKRALANLIRNAIRHAGHAGPIVLSARRDDQRVIVLVSDSGPGVPEESLAQLFDPFYRVDTSRTRDSGGVGLGLTIVKSCVEACQGKAVCRNAKPAGFVAEITLHAG